MFIGRKYERYKSASTKLPVEGSEGKKSKGLYTNMTQLKQFVLDSNLAHHFFLENLSGTNVLSSRLVELIDFNLGHFFTILPDRVDLSKIHQFQTGGIAEGMRNHIASFIFEKLSSNDVKSCIFDDYGTTYQEGDAMDPLFTLCGVEANKEVYYVLTKENVSISLINRCLIASDVIWHSLCILTNTQLIHPINNNKLDTNKINDICMETKLIILGAYDEEGYVFWEKIKD